jgi:mono/diheme cytochrome c family protein
MNFKLYHGLVLLLIGYVPFKNALIEANYLPIISKEVVTTSNVDAPIARNLQAEGEEIYADFCIQCHGANGKGDGRQFPPLAGSDWLIKKRKESIHAVKYGQRGEIVVNKLKYNNLMPALGLSNQEVADVMNYIMTSWGNKQKLTITEKEVAAILK